MRVSIVLGSLHYIKKPDGREELFDFSDDPLEERNLASSDGSQRDLQRCRLALARIAGPGAELVSR